MRRQCLAVVGLIVLFATIFAAGVYSQTPPAAPAGDSQPKVRVVFYYGKPFHPKACRDLVGILIDNVNVHEIADFHIWQTELTPGLHTIIGDSQKDKAESATLAAGQTYYYEILGFKGFGFPTCPNFAIKFEPMKPKDIQKASAQIGKPGVDESMGFKPTPPVAATPAAYQEPPKSAFVKLMIQSSPEAADIEVDGSFVGNTPSAVELPPGQHTVAISKKGFAAWTRTIKLAAGDIEINAELEKPSATP